VTWSRRLGGYRTETLLGASGVFLVCWGLVHRWIWSGFALVDWPTYSHYGNAIVDLGLVPYRDFPVEYPPGALAVFVPPAWFGDYASAFAWEMALCGVLLVAAVTAIRPAAAFYVALAPVLTGSLILSRFDLWPTLLTVVALLLLLEGWHRLGWAFMGAAVAAKLWPLVIVPVALVWSWHAGRIRAALAGLAVALAIFLPFAVVAPHGVWDSLSGQASRPLQVEGLGASLLTTFGHPRIVTTHGSQNVAGHGAFAALFGVLQVAALIAVWLGFARGPATRERFLRFAAASVCAFVAFGKVLSPQFLIWLIPLVPLVRGKRGIAATVLLTLALILTQVWFPKHYWDYALQFDRAGVVLARDLALVALFAVLIWPSVVETRR
jgi:uncharacterized membrane protein